MKKLILPLLTLVFAGLARAAIGDDVGLQLWSLREQFKKDVPAALDQVKAFGFSKVETAGTYNLGPEKLRDELKARGLKPVSAHMPFERLSQDLPGVIAEAKTLGVDYVIVPWLPHKEFDETAAKEAAANFNKWSAALKEAGLKFGYHPHGFEFRKLQDGSGDTVFDLLIRSTDAAVVYEMDVFWVKHAGIDPAQLLAKYPARWKLLHVKDLRKGAVTGLTTGGAPPTDNVAVGDGQIDWPAVLATAKKIGVEHYFIEDESPAPLQNIPTSLRYLKSLKL